MFLIKTLTFSKILSHGGDIGSTDFLTKIALGSKKTAQLEKMTSKMKNLRKKQLELLQPLTQTVTKDSISLNMPFSYKRIIRIIRLKVFLTQKTLTFRNK